jgi:hypothetical protein
MALRIMAEGHMMRIRGDLMLSKMARDFLYKSVKEFMKDVEEFRKKDEEVEREISEFNREMKEWSKNRKITRNK